MNMPGYYGPRSTGVGGEEDVAMGSDSSAFANLPAEDLRFLSGRDTPSNKPPTESFPLQCNLFVAQILATPHHPQQQSLKHIY
jgi:hypothetical protein